ncbi:MAG: sugar phosphate isomerase/epimerase [Planctomycetaceae bacterium]|nr:sugar phosphate isomerase/epimerase [Planctomycetaceae bacterium]
MKLGIGSYTYTWAVGVPDYPAPAHPLGSIELIEAATRHGAATVQLSDNIDLLSLDSLSLTAIRRHAEARDVTLHIGTRGIDPGHMRGYLSLARSVGATLVRTILPKTGTGSTIDDARGLLREVIGDYEREAVAVSIENHDLNSSRELRELVDAVGSTALGICLDTVNSLGIGEDHRRTLDTLAPVTNCFHAKDYRVSRIDHQMGFKVEGVPCGDGLLDLPAIVDCFSRLGRDPDLVVELWTPYQGDIENTVALERVWADRSVAYCRGIL